jgi:hypothetical protein
MSPVANLKNTFTWKKPEPVDCDAPATGSPAAVTINDDDRTRIEGQGEHAAPAPAPMARMDAYPHDAHVSPADHRCTPTNRSNQPAFPVEHRKFGNPAPLGLFGFAATTLMLGLYYVQTRHITVVRTPVFACHLAEFRLFCVCSPI